MKRIAALGSLCVLFTAWCGGCIPQPPPDAHAGAPQNDVLVGERVELNGSGSTDPNMYPLTYSWSQNTGPRVRIENANSMIASFTPGEAGTYIFTLVVSNEYGGTDDATVEINVIEAADGDGVPEPADDADGIDSNGQQPVDGDEQYDSPDEDDSAPAVELPVVSTFDSGDEGWRVQGGNLPEPTQPQYEPFGGYILSQAGGEWYWIAPAAFRGDFSAAYNGDLEFDLTWNPDKPCGSKDYEDFVFLSGGGYTIWHEAPTLPTETPTGYSLRLHESESWYLKDTNTRVTKLQLMALLSDLSQVKIRGNFWHSKNQGCEALGTLDNVAIESPR
jgi:hypothetical protein